MATRMEDVVALAKFGPRLKALGYRSAEQVLGAGTAAPLALGQYLGIDAAALAALMNVLRGGPPLAAAAVAAPIRHRLGVRLDLMPRRANFAMAVSASVASPLPPSTDLIDQMRPVRDQGDRGTCVAHATSAIAEHYWTTQGKIVDLSRQFVYWDCKQHDGHPNEEGTWIAIAMPLLQSDGCPQEGDWPYVSTDIPGNEGEGPAPARALDAAGQFRIPGFRQLSATAVHDLKAELADGRPIAFSIPVFDSWWRDNKEVASTGDITNPIPGELPDGGHAMCMVGYQDDQDDQPSGGGRFLIRNSWDSTWGTASSTGHVGYGTIPYSYIARFAIEAFTVA